MNKEYSYIAPSGLPVAGVYYAGLHLALMYDAPSGQTEYDDTELSPEGTRYGNDGCSPSDMMNNYRKVLKGRYMLTSREAGWKSKALKEYSSERAK
jgi:hypothetical protein